MENGDAYRDGENREVCETFLSRARRFQSGGENREALKAFSQAEPFAVEPGAIRAESDALMKKLRSDSRKRALAGVAAVLALGTAIAFWWPNQLPMETKSEHTVNRTVESPASLIIGNPVGTDADPQSPSVAAKHISVPPPTEPVSSSKRLVRAKPSNGYSAQGSTRIGTEEASGDASVPTGGGADGRIPVSGLPEPAPTGAAQSEAVLLPPATIPARAGYLIVKSSPPFANLFVDGKEAGITPTKSPLEMKPGEHGLILERNGCKPVHTAFTISPGDTTLVRLTLEKIGPDQP